MSRKTLNSLVSQVDGLEAQIEEHGKVLKRNKVGMHEPMTDSQDYPRNDIDVLAVRHARRAIIYLQNDRKKVLAVLEKEMALMFEQEQKNALPSNVQEQQPNEPMDVDHSAAEVVKPTLEPFAVVEKVEPGQLADRMGITIQDKILQIGTLSAHNFKSLNQIQSIFLNSRGGKLQIVVRKANAGKDVTVVVDLSDEGSRLGLLLKPLKG